MTWEAKVNTPAAKIFLADNGTEMRRLQQLLSQRYEVQVGEGLDTLSTIQQQPLPDLVIADVMLAGSNEWEWMRSLRSHPQTQDLTVFLLSAKAEEEICTAALAAGADDYLSQPFSDSQLLARIEVNLKMRQVRQATLLHQQELIDELAATKQQVTNILESMTDAFYALDCNWCITYINRGGESVIGKPRHELLGKNLWELCPVLVNTEVYQQYHRCLAAREAIHFEFYYQPCDCWYDIHVYPSEQGITSYFHNISDKQVALRDRQQAEAALKIQERKYRYIFEAAGVAIFEEDFSLVKTALDTLKAQGIEDFATFFAENPDVVQQLIGTVRIVNANNAAVKMFGAEGKNQLLGSLHRIFVPETVEIFVQELLVLVAGQNYLESETILQTLQGKQLNILFTITFPPPTAEFDSVLVTMMDITAHRQAEAAVRASEERLRSFFEANLVGIIFGDENGSIREANDEFLRIIGYSRTDLQTGQLRWVDITPPEYFDCDELGIAEAHVKGACTPYEKEFIRKDGSRVPVVVGYSLLRESRQQSVAFILDISSRKQTERALHQSEARFQAFMDNSPAAAWITDSKGRIVYLSPTYSSTFKLLTNDAIGRSIFDLYPVEIAEKFLKNIQKVAQTNEVVEAIELAPLPDGSTGDFLVYKFPIADPSGQRLVGGVAVDITERERALRERQKAEQALQKHSDRLKLLSETASDLLSTEHPLELMSDLFAKLSAQMELQFYFNYLIDTQENRQKLRLKSWSGIDEEILPLIESLEFGEAVCGLAAQTRRQIIVNNVQHSTHPNTQILCTLKITAYAAQPLIARGKLLGVLSFGSSTRTQFTPEEIALLQATSDQIAIALERAELMASLQQQTEQLIQANRVKDEFLAVLSHELRTPLNPILGWSQLLRTQKYDEATTARALETIERNAKLQTELIEDLLDVSRILQGKLSLNITQVDLAATINAAIETVRLAAEAKCIQLQVSVQPNMAPVVGDSARLQQVVWNLVSNAVKFTPKHGQIEIAVEYQASQVQLQVRDTGKGISPEFLPYVFDYFRQADGTSTRKFGGLGLGLAIVRHLVELHGGTVKAESAGEGQGATFTVTLPIIQLNLASNCSDPAINFSPDLQGVKVLVVDDEVDTRELISFILEESGAEVMQARSALEALQALTHFQPHVLLSDIGMPDMDGYMLIRQLRSMPSEIGRQIPAIALTAYAGEINQQQALSAGFQTHITKPINPSDLAATIAQAVGRNQWRSC
ncbi:MULTISPECIES: PAS domain S-box protein [unclassified Tolypothrix]|uniref:PAS domain S-box protein n=1 Tax=unclassified Tolypothrix TaxID=2649714 RepID=UPI0005EAAFC1|nr:MULTISPECIES: PAS domain S-box protein [unclassified Tolypothrix]BAY91582.1 multi-sensor hybrid histidine kinase [Microchaete diplosiphon NIES-3275]EKF05331.1 sensor histidine kinase [Tolypothrix sp. PCC 7601]MBE9087628.1 PAS domain S-box protein [Tolypothrix sp. LEGE 11397]UYD25609.1 PAS domain S-box protein [Tolypothrix sp. PCC 7712]UYD32150.1 PAS domain S-box protein [Tolypothrix sp. PCC 7601]